MAIQHIRLSQGQEPVLLLPDWFGGSSFLRGLENWIDQERYGYVAADYRGYGASRDQGGEYSLAEMSRDALELADSLGWKRFHVVGHSMSGKVVQLLAASTPARLLSATAMTPTPPVALDLDEEVRGLLESCETSLDSRRTALNAATGSQYGASVIARLANLSMMSSRPQAYRAYLDAWSSTDISMMIGASKYPLQIILGEKDPFVPEDFTRATTMAVFPNAELRVLEGIGHYPLQEAPPRTVSILEDIFARATGLA